MKYDSPALKAVVFVLILFVSATVEFAAYGQSKKKTGAPHKTQDVYSMGINSPNKPKLKYFLVRLKGDNAVSIIDLDGNVIARNFTPVVNSQGEVRPWDKTSPVLDDVFCIKRYKRINDYNGRRSAAIYHNAAHPAPIAGLTDLYDANIINPNLFPICKRGERIKFVDNKGNVKFTVMPIDGKEPHWVRPMIANGIIVVEVAYKGKAKPLSENPANDNSEREEVTRIIEKEGAIDTTGKWVIYPEWDRLESMDDGRIIGWKDGVRYRVSPTGKSTQDPLLNDYIVTWPLQGKYLIEIVRSGGGNTICNIYDLKQNYITTIDNVIDIDQNIAHPDILNVQGPIKNISNYSIGTYYLMDLAKNKSVISKSYNYLRELPNGNYYGRNSVKKGDNHIYKCWYVKADGTETALPDNCRFPIEHPLTVLWYDADINRFIVMPDVDTPGYICDFNGNKVGNILFDEYYHREWEAEPVKSSYWRRHVLGETD